MPGEKKDRNSAADAYFSAADMLFVFDADTRYKFANSHAERYLGKDNGTILGKTAKEVLGDTEDTLSKHVKRAICSRQSIHTLQRLKIHGEDKVFDIVLAPLRDTETNAMNVYGIFRDVTELSKEREISQIDGWQDVLENLPTAVYQIMEDEDGQPLVSYIGSEFQRIMGQKINVGEKDIYLIWENVASKDIPHVKKVVKHSIQERESWSFTYHVIKKDGKERYVKETVSCEKSQIGRSRIWTGVITDISELETRNKQPTGKADEKSAATDTLNWETDSEWKITKMAPKALELLGYAPEEIEGKPLSFLAGAENKERMHERLERLRKEERHFANYLFPFVNKHGKEISFRASGTPCHDAENRFKGYSGTFTEADNPKSPPERTQEDADYFKQLLELSPIAMYATHPKNELAMTRISRNVENILGYTADAFLSDPHLVLKLIHPDDQAIFLEKSNELIHSEDYSHTCEYRLRHKDGEYVWLKDQMHILKDERGKIREIVGYWTNVNTLAQKDKKIEFNKSERGLLEKQLEEANSRLEESMIYAQHMAQEAELANIAKTNFLTNMSHEIRTPMSSIMGIASILGDTHLTPEQKDYVHTILRSSESMIEIVNDLLDFAKIEAGKMELEEIQYDLVHCIEDSIDLFGAKAAEKDIELLYEIDPDVPTVLKGDPSRLRQVIINLIGNAIKFTPEGEVHLKASLDKYNGQDAILKFSVSDTGIGIPSEAREHLFKAFSQAEPSTSRKHGGTGLGLTICKKLLKMMQGEIWFTSKEGEGTTFFFTLRTKLGDAATNDDAHLHATLLAGKHLLIVDPRATSRVCLTSTLEKWGANVSTAHDKEECLAQIKQLKHCDLVIIKDGQKKADFIDLIQQLKDDSETYNIPLIVIHPKHKKETRESCQHIEGLFFIGSPVRKAQLLSGLTDALSIKSKSNKDDMTRYSFQEHKVEHNDLQILTVEDNKVNQKVTILTLEKLGYEVDAARNGLDAINMLQAKTYDIVFMDMYMPQMNGFETTRWIRQNLKNRKQPYIIAMTAAATDEDKQKCIEASVDDHVLKPYRVENIVKALENYRLKTKGLDNKDET